MSELISLETARKERALTVEEAWQAYLVARDRAEQSRDVWDGIAAGKAWRRFLELFDRRTA